MTITLTNKQTTYTATQESEAFGIKLEGTATIDKDNKLAMWQGNIYQDDEYVGNFYYANNGKRISTNVDTSHPIVDTFNLLTQGVSDIQEELNGVNNEESEGIDE